MFPLVELPKVVQHYAPFFKDVFSADAFVEFERYISGLIVSENKTVDGINRLFVTESRNQSSLNRFLTASPYELDSLNQKRLDLLDHVSGTQMKPKGVFSIDDTLLTHYGQDFDQIAKLFDPVSESYVWAHDLVTLHYSDDLTDYPVLFRLWKPPDIEQLEQGLRAAQLLQRPDKEAWKTTAPQKWRSYLLRVWQRRHGRYPELERLYQSKLIIAQELLEHWVAAHPEWKLPVTFDTWYTQPAFCRCLHQRLSLSYVGTLTEKDRVNLKTGPCTVADFAAQLKGQHLAALKQGGHSVFWPITIPYKGKTEQYYSYCNTHHIHSFGKQRLVINYQEANLSDKPTFYISNRLTWQAARITRIRRHRWPVDVYHEEGKAEGLAQYQLRDFSGIERHVGLVAVVYSLLRAAQQDPDLRTQLQRDLQIELDGSAGLWCRATQAQSLWSLGVVISAGLAQGQTMQQVMAPFVRAICGIVNR